MKKSILTFIAMLLAGVNTAWADDLVKIGTQGYATIQEAINAAPTDGSATTIKFVSSNQAVSGNGFQIPDGTTGKNLIIDFNGCTYTVTGGAVGSSKTLNQCMHFAPGNTLKLIKGTVNVQSGLSDIKIMMQNYCDLTLDHFNVDCSNIIKQTYSGSSYGEWEGKTRPVFNFNSGTSTITNSTITFSSSDEFGLLTDKEGSAASVTIGAGTTINGNVTALGGHATINGGTINGNILVDKVEDDQEEGSITINGGKLNGTAASNFGTMTINNNLAIARLSNSDNTSYVFTDLEAAFDNAFDGDTIELQKDVTLNNNIFCDKQIFFKFGNFNVTKGNYSIKLSAYVPESRAAIPAAFVGGLEVYTDKLTDIFAAAESEGTILVRYNPSNADFPYTYQAVNVPLDESIDEAVAVNKQTGMLFGDLQLAVDLASAGNTIELLPGIENVTITKTVNINKGIILDGQNYKVTSSLEDEDQANNEWNTVTPTAFRITGNGDVTINKLDLNVTFKRVDENEFEYTMGGTGIKVDNNYGNRLTVNYCTITTLSRGIDVYSASSSFNLDVKHTKIYAGDEDLTDDDEFDPTTEYIHTFEDDPYQRSRGINFGAVSGVKANIQFCEIAGFSYPINAGKNANHIEVNMIDCTTYGRATVNNWGNSNKFNLSKITAHAYNNQEEGDTETFAIVVDNEGYVYENNERIHVVASYNNYFLDDVKSIANVEVSDETLDTDATQKFVDLRGTDATVKITGDSGYDIDEDTWDRVGFMDNEQMHNLLDPAINNKIYFDDTAKAYFTFWFETIEPFEHDFGGEIGTKTVRLGISDEMDHTNLYPVIDTYPKVMLTMTPEDFEGEPKVFYFETLKQAFDSEYFVDDAEITIMENITLDEDITPNLQRGESFTLGATDPSFKITPAEKPVEVSDEPVDPEAPVQEAETYHILLNPLVKVYYDGDNSLFAPSDPETTDILELSNNAETEFGTSVTRSYTAANVYWSGDVEDINASDSYYWLFDELFTNDENASAIFSPGAYTRLEMDIPLVRDLKLPTASNEYEWEEDPEESGDEPGGGSRRMADDEEIAEYWLDFNSADEYDTDAPLYTLDKGEYSISLKPGQWVYTTALTDVFSSGDAAYYVTYDVLEDVNGANIEKTLQPRKVGEDEQTIVFRYKYYLQKDGLAIIVDPATYCGDRLTPNFIVKKKVVNPDTDEETWVELSGISQEDYDAAVAAAEAGEPDAEDVSGYDFTWHLVPPATDDPDDKTYIDAKTYVEALVIEGISFQGIRKADFVILPRDIKDVTVDGNVQSWREDGYTPAQIEDLITLVYECVNHGTETTLIKNEDYIITVADDPAYDGNAAHAAINYVYPSYTYDGMLTQADAETIDYYITRATATANGVVNDLARFLGALYRAGGVTTITYGGEDYTWSTEPGGYQGSNWRDADNNTLVSTIISQFTPALPSVPENITFTTDKGNVTVNLHVVDEMPEASSGYYKEVGTYSKVITITAVEGGNYTGTMKVDFTILPTDLIDIAKCMVVSNAVYTSDQLPPTADRITVIWKNPATDEEIVVDPSVYDIEVHGADGSYVDAKTYSNAITIVAKPDATMTIGEDPDTEELRFYGELDADYVIKQRDIADDSDADDENDSNGYVVLEAYAGKDATETVPKTYPLQWTGSEIVPVINDTVVKTNNNINLVLKAKDDKGVDIVPWLLKPISVDLTTYDYSYTIEPSPMIDPGEYKIIFTGRGNFTGMREVNVMVLKDISADEILAEVPLQIILGNTDLSTSELQDVTITDSDLGTELVEGVHYALEIREGEDGEDEATDVIKGDGVYFAHFKGLEPYYTKEKEVIFPAVFEYYSWDAKENSTDPGTAAAYYNNQTYPDGYTVFRGPLDNPNIVSSIHIQLPGKDMKATIGGRPGYGAAIDNTYEDFTLDGLVTLNVEQANGTDYPQLDFTVVGIDDDAFMGCNDLHWVDATQIAGYTPENLSRSETAPFNGYPVQSLVYLDGTQGGDVTGTNYIYKKGDHDFRCEELKIYDDQDGKQQSFTEGGGPKWEFRNIYEFTAEKVTNTRYFIAGQHYTTCLPYKLEVTSGLKVYTLDAASDNIFGFKELSLNKLSEFTPYLLIPSKGGNLLSNADQTVVYETPTEYQGIQNAKETPTGHKMFGSTIYMDKETIDPTVTGLYIMQSKNTWKKIPADTEYNGACVLPMRAYIQLPEGTPAREYIMAQFTDAIGSLSNDVNDDWTDAEVYDLQGRKVDTTSKLPKGVYIVNGQKRIKK